MIYMEADVDNAETGDELKREFDRLTESIAEIYQIPDVNKRPAIAATRQAYKTFGKDPNRYRPSQEQLMRRVVRGLGLYNVNNLVDSGNILSLTTGCSVGVFDRDKIQGDLIRLGVGEEGEPYEGIGRGPINISGIPVIRDAEGGFGTPTSDNERTKTELDTKRVSVTVHVFDSSVEDLADITARMVDIFSRHCNARNIETTVVRP
ncbi:MAG: hypothetical protein HDS98_04300 [Bacteroidales bacterium]|nr:hypothetical protein [Bacteroidales bacterium]